MWNLITILYRNLLWGTEENHENRIAVLSFEIWIRHLPTTKQEYFPLSNDVRWLEYGVMFGAVGVTANDNILSYSLFVDPFF
jgi:hypothetical protein